MFSTVYNQFQQIFTNVKSRTYFESVRFLNFAVKKNNLRLKNKTNENHKQYLISYH